MGEREAVGSTSTERGPGERDIEFGSLSVGTGLACQTEPLHKDRVTLA